MGINRKKTIIPLVAFIVLTGYVILKYNSVENQTARMAKRDIYDWFHTQLSEETSIKARGLLNGLDENWRFSQKMIDMKNLGLGKFFIIYSYTFKNSTTGEYFFADEYYYYDLDEVTPIPLKRKTYRASNLSDTNTKTDKLETLWNGDFNTYCKKP